MHNLEELKRTPFPNASTIEAAYNLGRQNQLKIQLDRAYSQGFEGGKNTGKSPAQILVNLLSTSAIGFGLAALVAILLNQSVDRSYKAGVCGGVIGFSVTMMQSRLKTARRK